MPLSWDLDRTLAILIEDGEVEQLYNSHVRASDQVICASRSKSDQPTEIGIEQVGGLWIMLLISLGIAGAILAWYALQRHRQQAVHVAITLASSVSERMREGVTSRSFKKSISDGSAFDSHTKGNDCMPDTATGKDCCVGDATV